ncbi:MAG: hypothetical protein FJ194_18265 [Gammaproteobacteria bacterium]|nr:hypothetical protein [Gammaproteobacteria bacterium]
MNYSPVIPDTQLDGEMSVHQVRARQEIEYLRRWYCRATDLFGMTNNRQANAEAKRIYQRIFTPDARIRVTGDVARQLQAIGPEGWAMVVTNALQDYTVTQHLLGTQLVDIRSLTIGRKSSGPDEISEGEAGMTSYLQAWHVWPDKRLRVVMGNYVDQVRFVPGIGWQIHDMNLVHLMSEHRMLGEG